MMLLGKVVCVRSTGVIIGSFSTHLVCCSFYEIGQWNTLQMLQVSVIDHSLDHGASLPFVPFYSELLICFGVLSFLCPQ